MCGVLMDNKTIAIVVLVILLLFPGFLSALVETIFIGLPCVIIVGALLYGLKKREELNNKEEP